MFWNPLRLIPPPSTVRHVFYPFWRWNIANYAGTAANAFASAVVSAVGCAPPIRRRRHGLRGLPQNDPPRTAVGARRSSHVVLAALVEKRRSRHRRGPPRRSGRRRRLGVSQVLKYPASTSTLIDSWSVSKFF